MIALYCSRWEDRDQRGLKSSKNSRKQIVSRYLAEELADLPSKSWYSQIYLLQPAWLSALTFSYLLKDQQAGQNQFQRIINWEKAETVASLGKYLPFKIQDLVGNDHLALLILLDKLMCTYPSHWIARHLLKLKGVLDNNTNESQVVKLKPLVMSQSRKSIKKDIAFDSRIGITTDDLLDDITRCLQEIKIAHRSQTVSAVNTWKFY